MTTLLATFTGPSGAGKSTYCREILKCWPDWKLVTSLTTRAPRPVDLPGEYQYVTAEEFEHRRSMGDFLWVVSLHGHRYGTARLALNEVASSPRPSIMLIEPACVPLLRAALVMHGGRRIRLLHFYFCAPLEAELRGRFDRRRECGDRTDEAEINRRIAECRTWDSEAYASGIPYVFLPGDISLVEATTRIVNVFRHLGGQT